MGCVCNMWVGLAMGAVLRALCRVAVLRVLTAYIPRTPGPKKATRAWPEPGLLPLGAMEYAWNMYELNMCMYMEYVWNMEHGIYRACLQKKKTYGLCMDLLRIRIENVRIAYANSPLGLDGVGHY